MKAYKHLFFDLDHTIWDFETNSTTVLRFLFDREKLQERGVPSFEKFYATYKPINDRYWARYHHKLAAKEEVRIGRFSDTLQCFELADGNLARRMAQDYNVLGAQMTGLFPDAMPVLHYLKEKYTLHLITNGFAETQRVKVQHSGLQPFFHQIIISEEVGTQKPDKEIFDLTMERAGACAAECVMMGDNFKTDIQGAKNAGIDQIYFNPKKNWVKDSPTYTVSRWIELKQFL